MAESERGRLVERWALRVRMKDGCLESQAAAGPLGNADDRARHVHLRGLPFSQPCDRHRPRNRPAIRAFRTPLAHKHTSSA